MGDGSSARCEASHKVDFWYSVYDRASATADLGSLATIRRQCAGYLPVSHCWLSMTACWFRLQPDPTHKKQMMFSLAMAAF